MILMMIMMMILMMIMMTKPSDYDDDTDDDHGAAPGASSASVPCSLFRLLVWLPASGFWSGFRSGPVRFCRTKAGGFSVKSAPRP